VRKAIYYSEVDRNTRHCVLDLDLQRRKVMKKENHPLR